MTLAVRSRPLVALAVIGVVAIVSASVSPPFAAAGPRLSRAAAAEAGQNLDEYGALVEGLVASYDQAQEHQARVLAQLQAFQARLDADVAVENKAVDSLRAVALESYMTGAADGATGILPAPDDTLEAEARREYVAIASHSLSRAIDTVRRDEQQTRTQAAELRAKEGLAAAGGGALDRARAAAEAAVRQDILLAQVNGNMSSLLGSAAAQNASAQPAQEETLAASAATAAASGGHPVPPVSDPRPGRYRNPLRDLAALRPSRVDMGVDYTGYGPIWALGPGVVLSTTSSGWPGGTFVSYELTGGRAAGLVVYVAEDLEPLVSVGQEVTADTVLGTMYEGPSGIETGWADPSADGSTMAGDAGQFRGANATAFGTNFSALLASLGAPPGVAGPSVPTGTLPPNWPAW